MVYLDIGLRLCGLGEEFDVFQRDKALPDEANRALEPTSLDLCLHQGAEGERERSLHCHLVPEQGHPAV